jgi:hypothetical protein
MLRVYLGLFIYLYKPSVGLPNIVSPSHVTGVTVQLSWTSLTSDQQCIADQ